MSYTESGTIELKIIAKLLRILDSAKWKVVRSEDRYFKTWYPESVPPVFAEFGKIDTAFFLNIPPGGSVHKHVDTCRVAKTYHIPIQTNPGAIGYMLDKPHYLEVGKIYEVDRQIEHHSVNTGGADRIHLLIECII